MTEYDYNFEANRLKNLQDQTLTADVINGTVILGCLPDSSEIDFASFLVDKIQMEKLKNSNFRELVLPLLGILSEYRKQHDIFPNQDCILEIFDSSLSLKWLENDGAEKLISKHVVK
ncbi:hypothetical protein H4J58_16780 [Colwellia sp. MB3u-70]|uniref:hypothetical protein n=1 Tax=unclassified Colwellia TaxID=196834 RepID=UPI0015F747E8|nr:MULTISPECIES: hypothetical protein [unclassified Colwellia]MBA6292758.1 hypothetical protein [Colwellia sp. MB3u-8]MBA6308770.1 hypothetical protein [Colwellia sp. MB3u-70]